MEIKKEEKTKQTIFSKSKMVLAVIIIAGVWIGYEIGIRAYFYYIRPYFDGMAYRNYVDDYIQLQLNDYTGGDTPEQTIDLFIKALQEGDYELASKYFVIDEQGKWKKMFQEMKIAGREQGLIDELENAKKIWHKEVQTESKVEFWYDIKEGEPSRDINLRKNINNKWKINSL